MRLPSYLQDLIVIDAAEELDMEIEFMVDASPGPGGTNDEAEQGPPEPPQARRCARRSSGRLEVANPSQIQRLRCSNC